MTGGYGQIISALTRPAAWRQGTISVLLRQQLWNGELNWLAMPGDDLPQPARTLDIFLDALAAHADTDASWVLDERFEALLEEGDTDIPATPALSGGRSRTANRGAACGPCWPGTASPEPRVEDRTAPDP
jgi:hypothetical protein